MGRRVKETIKKVNKVTEIVGSHHTGAYAAQAAYFFVLSMIPIILLLLTAVQFTPSYLCKCHRCSGAGVSDIRAGVYPFDRDTGLFFPVG